LGRDHTDLAFVGPRYKLIRFCHNSVHFSRISKNFTGHPAARVRGQYTPGVDLRPVLLKYVPVMAYRMFMCA
jgi:hypothetical protein